MRTRSRWRFIASTSCDGIAENRAWWEFSHQPPNRRGCPEFFGTLIVVLKREVGVVLQVLRMQFHIHPTRATVYLALAA
jgi:hypothetical protein